MFYRIGRKDSSIYKLLCLHLDSLLPPTALELNIPPMMIQPFVENAVEHGFDREDKEKEIDINFEMQQEK